MVYFVAFCDTNCMAVYLRAWRISRQYTQEDIALAVGVSVPTVQRWEGGTRNPGVDDLEKIAEALHVPTGWLFTDPGSEIPPLTPEEQAIINQYRELSERDRAQYKAVTDALTQSTLKGGAKVATGR